MSKRKKLLIVLLCAVFGVLLGVMVTNLLSEDEKGSYTEPTTEVVLVDRDNPDEPNNAPIVEETTSEQTTVVVQRTPPKKIDSPNS